MLDGHSTATVCLHSVCDCGSSFSADQGILGEIFKVSSAKGHTVDIHSRSKPDMNTKSLHLLCDDVTACLTYFFAPALCKSGSDRYCSAILVVYLTVSFLYLLIKSEHLQNIIRKQSLYHIKGAVVNRICAALVNSVFRIKSQARRSVCHNNNGDSLIL